MEYTNDGPGAICSICSPTLHHAAIIFRENYSEKNLFFSLPHMFGYRTPKVFRGGIIRIFYSAYIKLLESQSIDNRTQYTHFYCKKSGGISIDYFPPILLPVYGKRYRPFLNGPLTIPKRFVPVHSPYRTDVFGIHAT